MNQQKQLYRAVASYKRQNIDIKTRERANLSIASHTMTYITHDISSVCLYIATPEEVSTEPLIKYLQKKNKNIAVPKITGSHLELYYIQSKRDLAPGMYNMLEPTNYCVRCDVSNIDAFIVPGLAFDPFGHRLGRGKGYYDKLLAQINVPIIGLAFHEQMFSLLPFEPYDIVMDIIVTENEAYEIKKSNTKTS